MGRYIGNRLAECAAPTSGQQRVADSQPRKILLQTETQKKPNLQYIL
jgi:hypothetical protein